MKRVVFVTGDKGGVGKSFTSRLLLDWYLSKGIPVHAFDTDKTNSTLYRFFKDFKEPGFDIDQLDTDNQEVLDQLLNSVVGSSGGSVFMVDCAARTLEQLLSWMAGVGFFDLAEEHEIKVTLAFILGPEKDCVQILSDISTDSNYGSKVDYILIKNEGKGPQFKIYDSSNVRSRLLNGSNAVELSIPALVSSTALEVDRLNLSFSLAQKSSSLGVAERSRVKIYQNRVFQEFEKAGSLWT